METYVGFHCVTHPDGIGMLIQSGANLVLSVDNVGVLEEAERLRPGINKIMRFFVPNITAEEGRKRDPVEFARWYVQFSPMAEKIKVNIAALRMPNLWLQGWNEPVFKKPGPVPGIDIDDDEGFNWLAEAEAERIRLLAGMGIRAASFALSTGYPTIEQFGRLASAFPAMRLHGACFLIHGYSTREEMAANLHDCNRHEMYYEVTKSLGFGDIPFAYGEAGREWQAQGVSDTDYRDQIASYDTRIRNFVKASGCNVLGFALYTLGDDSNRTWGKYKLDGRMPEFLSEYLKWIRQQPDTEPVPQPAPVPVPVPVPPPVVVSTKFKLGDVVETMVNLYVRSGPSLVAAILGTQPKGTKATVKGVAEAGSGLAWWPLGYPTQSGYSAESQGGAEYLKLNIPPAPAQTPPRNLLRNPSFEEGYYLWHGVPELATPNEWDFWYQGDVNVRLERQDDPFFPPEGVVWNKKDAPEHEKELFFLSGNFCLKEFKGWGPIWWRLSQRVDGLVVGRRYRFSAPVFPDLVMKYENGNKVWADDPLAGEVMLTASNKTWEIGFWKTGRDFPFGKYTTHSLEFTADEPTMMFALACRGRWGLLENGFFVDSLSLVEIP